MPNDSSTRIVIVDDQPSIRHLVYSSLQHIGYRNLSNAEMVSKRSPKSSRGFQTS